MQGVANVEWIRDALDVSIKTTRLHAGTTAPMPIPNASQLIHKKDTCSCGHDTESVWISPKAIHKPAKFWYGVFWGASGGKPDRIDWVCRLCGDVLATSTDPEHLLLFRHE